MPASYDVVACERCGFVYADQATSQGDLDRDYEAHSKYAANVAKPVAAATVGDAPTDSPWDAARLAEAASYIASRVPITARVLDAGCSSGTFLRRLAELGFSNGVGLDPSHDAVASAVERNGVDARAGSFTSPPEGLGTFDAITLSHTLEHIADVRGAVASLRALLNDGGLAYIEVPDATLFDRYLVAPFNDFNTEHINHFSLDVLRSLMNDAGFAFVDGGAKLVRCSERDPYPVIYGLWVKTRELAVGTDSFERDQSLVDAAKRYVDVSKTRMERIDRDLTAALRDDDDVIVWGAGQLAMKLLVDTVLATKRITAIVDSSPQRHGMHVGSTEIVAPSALTDLPRVPIVIASVHADDAIARTIEESLRLPHRIVRLYREDLLVN